MNASPADVYDVGYVLYGWMSMYNNKYTGNRHFVSEGDLPCNSTPSIVTYEF